MKLKMLLTLMCCAICHFAWATKSNSLVETMHACTAIEFSESESKAIVTNDDYLLWLLSHVIVWMQKIFSELRRDEYTIYGERAAANTASKYVVTLVDENDILSYYIGDHKTFPLCIKISSRKLQSVLSNFIDNRFESLAKELEVRDHVDAIFIYSSEGDALLRLHFQDGRLDSIFFKATYVD